MARLAERPEVGTCVVAAVTVDMVNLDSRCNPAFPAAEPAKRLIRENRIPHLSPAPAIAPLGRALTVEVDVPVVFALVTLAKPAMGQRPAARTGAGFRRLARHEISNEKRPAVTRRAH